MRIIDVPQPGGPDALVVAQRPVPTPQATEVLIKIAAAGINRADVLQRKGGYPPPAGAPSYPGLEASGIVAEVGSAVRDFKVGDKVCALLQGGGYAEYCTVDEGQVLPVPGALSMIEAASLPEAYFTVWSNVFGFGRLQPGETLLVHGGSSGIGVSAIQLAKALGHTVFTTAGSDDKCRFCEQLGAKRAINYKSEDFVAVIAEETGKRGVNVLLDMIGGSYLSKNLACLAIEGRLVIIATQGGLKGEAELLRIMQRRLTITGSTLRPREVAFKRTVKQQLLTTVWPLLAKGQIQPIVDQVFPLERANEAHAYMESSAHRGKIVIAVDA
ncbi:NAD(P)H-quinone oxidoreductase [Steroidobacter sp.]|uniref:NAD(P)H-quinone oxidoreductase n=1 Tax=Steroidobacter sp. TaxID=1978227 RepID=UPI001A3C3B91|nr:NAD(P)H-quinone oxidoreductase [Steroidobacter sp.]MBL8267670.1 NAD(P)H-quinone oxidoreductase [Steroidobacter sp.]